jgi:hypothetical protein
MDKLLSVFVAETELASRAVFEIEMDPLHPVVDSSADARRSHIVGVFSLTHPFLCFG